MEVVNEFINNLFDKNDSYELSIIKFKKLAIFFKEENINWDLDFCIKLLNENRILYLVINKILKKNYLDIINGMFINHIKNELLITFLDAFIIINDIECKKNFEYSELDEYFQIVDDYKKENYIDKEKLFYDNLGLVVRIVRRYVNCGVDIEDLIQEGNIGLMEAVKKYDGNKVFIKYASAFILRRIERAIHNMSSVIRYPVGIYESLDIYNKTYQSLCNDLNNEPSILEISKNSGLSNYTVSQIKMLLVGVSSLEKIDYDIVYSDEEFVNDLIWNEVREMLDKLYDEADLTDKQRDVLYYSFFEGLNNAEIGNMLNSTRENIRQMLNKALKKLRASEYSKEFFNLICESDKVYNEDNKRTRSR